MVSFNDCSILMIEGIMLGFFLGSCSYFIGIVINKIFNIFKGGA